MSYPSELKRRLFPKGVRRELRNIGNRLFNRCTEDKLVAAFQRLQIPSGAYICVHSMLSGLGYLVGGPVTVIRALQRAVPECTLMMPSFPFSGSVKEYLDLGGAFDPQRTPSQSGILTECMRQMPGAIRSLHPTHPCVALGPGAHDLIDGAEQSVTPFGDDSTYGRFSGKPNAYLLLIHTNNTSMVHRIQEMVHMPNLFLDEEFEANTLLPTGKVKEFSVKSYTPHLPLFVVEGGEAGEREYLWFPDYLLLFPSYNYQRLQEKLFQSPVWDKLKNRHESFIERGIYRVCRTGSCELMSVTLSPWLQEINRDVSRSVETFAAEYDPANLSKRLREGAR